MGHSQRLSSELATGVQVAARLAGKTGCWHSFNIMNESLVAGRCLQRSKRSCSLIFQAASHFGENILSVTYDMLAAADDLPHASLVRLSLRSRSTVKRPRRSSPGGHQRPRSRRNHQSLSCSRARLPFRRLRSRQCVRSQDLWLRPHQQTSRRPPLRCLRSWRGCSRQLRTISQTRTKGSSSSRRARVRDNAKAIEQLKANQEQISRLLAKTSEPKLRPKPSAPASNRTVSASKPVPGLRPPQTRAQPQSTRPQQQ
jgi:hypothetical protein